MNFEYALSLIVTMITNLINLLEGIFIDAIDLKKK